MFINLRRYVYTRAMYLSALVFFLRRRVEHIRPFVGSSIYVLALDSLACDLYGSKRCLIAWHVVLGITVKIFKCEIICKRNNAWRIGRADFVKT